MKPVAALLARSERARTVESSRRSLESDEVPDAVSLSAGQPLPGQHGERPRPCDSASMPVSVISSVSM